MQYYSRLNLCHFPSLGIVMAAPQLLSYKDGCPYFQGHRAVNFRMHR